MNFPILIINFGIGYASAIIHFYLKHQLSSDFWYNVAVLHGVLFSLSIPLFLDSLNDKT